MADVVLPKKIYKIQTQNEFELCFDYVNTNFNDWAKDSYKDAFYLKCNNRQYKTLITRVIAQQAFNDKQKLIAEDNYLLTTNAKEKVTIESLIVKNKDKLILIDF